MGEVAPQPDEGDIGPLPDRLVAAAATGSLEAQRQLRDHAYTIAVTGAFDFAQALSVAEVFGQLAAAHGHAADRMVLPGLLLSRADFLERDSPDYSKANAIFQIDLAADAGDAGATVALDLLSQGDDNRAAFMMAREMREQAIAEGDL